MLLLWEPAVLPEAVVMQETQEKLQYLIQPVLPVEVAEHVLILLQVGWQQPVDPVVVVTEVHLQLQEQQAILLLLHHHKVIPEVTELVQPDSMAAAVGVAPVVPGTTVLQVAPLVQPVVQAQLIHIVVPP
jgi:hypothetical protein